MTNQKNNKAINIILWIAQGLLAIMFIMAGIMKTTQPLETLLESLPWVKSTPLGLVRFIGISELFGGLGLIVPSIFRFKPFLAVWAAIGLSIVMLLAAGFHASRGEFSAIGVNIVLIAIFLFIAWGRDKKAPILAKS
ncbi:DoxX family protein [Polaribacter pectinis]|uniref:DoxX family protein n=1 Tax=Polaribacter pectinis TaxID=2738844 RepID=A0A7G9LBW9_9FLAO|nr:DoxX family protein [Polaribacter pectinis]QNM86118.1 DoxX family protein [Polaribacter pectinis]